MISHPFQGVCHNMKVNSLFAELYTVESQLHSSDLMCSPLKMKIQVHFNFSHEIILICVEFPPKNRHQKKIYLHKLLEETKNN